MKRPTIALACILKNEIKNLKPFLQSVDGCFDEIHFTDTGSTDGSIQFIQGLGGEAYGAKIFLHHFDWVDDFAAARNYSFKHPKTDFVMWLDLDDSLGNREAFIAWRDTSMNFADLWLASYEYAYNEQGKSVCTFVRERVVRKSKKISWKYFVHEGLLPEPGEQVRANVIPTWHVKHRRTAEDQAQDKKRNLRMFEKHQDRLNHRMVYYYGKEFFENQMPKEALHWLLKAISDPQLELHDRVLGIQYAGQSAIQLGIKERGKNNLDGMNRYFTQAVQIAHQGLQLEPTRAEYHTIIADTYANWGKLAESIPYYHGAINSLNKWAANGGYSSPIFSHADAYDVYPMMQLGKVHYHMGQFDKALEYTEKVIAKTNSEESKAFLLEVKRAMQLTRVDGARVETDEIVITTPPQGAYEWDSELYKVRSMGGSETAAIEMSQWLKKLTGLPVKIFNMRSGPFVDDVGVQYIPAGEVNEYFSRYKPRLHIAWRHNIKLTEAPTYLWCHDLVTPTVDLYHNFNKIMCLTPFHARHVNAMQGVPFEKIMLTRNGLRPERFAGPKKEKNANKFVFPSSPDRGLDRAMLVLDEVRKDFPDIELHVFYGIEHLEKWGHVELQKKLKTMMDERPWVKYHGATEQGKLIEHFKEAAIWLHPCDFIETSCISAMEIVSCGVYPVTRRLGGLADTLKKAEELGMATLLDADPYIESELPQYVEATKKALREKSWERVSFDARDLSWESVAREWIREMNLPLKEESQPAFSRRLKSFADLKEIRV